MHNRPTKSASNRADKFIVRSHFLRALLLAAVGLLLPTLAAMAEPDWPRLPTDSEIAEIVRDFVKACAPEAPRDAVVKTAFLPMHNSTLIAKNGPLAASSLWITAVIYWKYTGPMSAAVITVHGPDPVNAVTCVSWKVKFQLGRFVAEVADFPSRFKPGSFSLLNPDYTLELFRTGNYSLNPGFAAVSPERPVAVKACPSVTTPSGETALLPAVNNAIVRVDIEGTPDSELFVSIPDKDVEAMKPAAVQFPGKQFVRLDASGRGRVTVSYAPGGTMPLDRAKNTTIQFSVGGKKVASLPIAIGIGLKGRVELRHLSTDTSANPDVSLAVHVSSRFHPTLDVAGFFDAWERDCPPENWIVLPKLWIRSSMGRHGWFVPEDADLPDAVGFGTMLFGKDAQGRSYLRSMSASTYTSPTGTVLPSIDLKVDAGHVFFPRASLALSRRVALDKASSAYLDDPTWTANYQTQTNEPGIFAPSDFVVIPVNRIPQWDELMACALEPKAEWQAFALSLIEVYPATSTAISVFKGVMQSYCEFARGEPKNAFITLLQTGNKELGEYIAFKGVTAERLQKWNSSKVLYNQLSEKELRDIGERIEAAYKAAQAVVEGATFKPTGR